MTGLTACAFLLPRPLCRAVMWLSSLRYPVFIIWGILRITGSYWFFFKKARLFLVMNSLQSLSRYNMKEMIMNLSGAVYGCAGIAWRYIHLIRRKPYA